MRTSTSSAAGGGASDGPTAASAPDAATPERTLVTAAGDLEVGDIDGSGNARAVARRFRRGAGGDLERGREDAAFQETRLGGRDRLRERREDDAVSAERAVEAERLQREIARDRHVAAARRRERYVDVRVRARGARERRDRRLDADLDGAVTADRVHGRIVQRDFRDCPR